MKIYEFYKIFKIFNRKDILCIFYEILYYNCVWVIYENLCIIIWRLYFLFLYVFLIIFLVIVIRLLYEFIENVWFVFVIFNNLLCWILDFIFIVIGVILLNFNWCIILVIFVLFILLDSSIISVFVIWLCDFLVGVNSL